MINSSHFFLKIMGYSVPPIAQRESATNPVKGIFYNIGNISSQTADGTICR